MAFNKGLVTYPKIWASCSHMVLMASLWNTELSYTEMKIHNVNLILVWKPPTHFPRTEIFVTFGSPDHSDLTYFIHLYPVQQLRCISVCTMKDETDYYLLLCTDLFQSTHLIPDAWCGMYRSKMHFSQGYSTWCLSCLPWCALPGQCNICSITKS